MGTGNGKVEGLITCPNPLGLSDKNSLWGGLNIRKAGLYVKRKKATCVTHEKKESLGTILAEKILGFDLRISCHYKLP